MTLSPYWVVTGFSTAALNSTIILEESYYNREELPVQLETIQRSHSCYCCPCSEPRLLRGIPTDSGLPKLELRVDLFREGDGIRLLLSCQLAHQRNPNSKQRR